MTPAARAAAAIEILDDIRAAVLAARQEARPRDILLAHAMVREDQLLAALGHLVDVVEVEAHHNLTKVQRVSPYPTA